MSTAFAFPYKTIPRELCEIENWQRIDPHENAEAVGDHIPGWDYDSHLSFGRSLKLNPKAIIESIGINGQNPKMTAIVNAETGPTSYRWTVSRVDIPQETEWVHDFQFDIDSVHLAQRLTLTTEIVLASSISDPGAFSAHQLGSRLYRDVHTVQLEGSLGRFPMEMLDFEKGLPFLQAPNALWYLDWDPSRPESQFLGTVLLYINSGHPEVSNLIQAAEPTILSILRCDVIRTMCEVMLRSDEFVSNYADYDTDTVGGQVREWLFLAYGEEKPAILQTKLDNSPGRFEARIQSAFS